MVSEIDLLAIDTTVAVVVECKTQLTVEYVDHHLQRLTQFKINFPQYAKYTVFGAVAGMVLPRDVSRYAYRNGLFVLAQSGDSMVIRNDSKFRPQQW